MVKELKWFLLHKNVKLFGIMKKNYIQPQTKAEMWQSTHIICTSVPGEIITNPTPIDPNSKEIF